MSDGNSSSPTWWAQQTPERRQQIAERSAATRRANCDARHKEAESLRQAAVEVKLGIDKLRRELAELEAHKAESEMAMSLTGKRLLTADEIVSRAAPWLPKCGIYFLIRGDRVIYVGQSTNLFSRITTHQASKEFDRFAYIECPRDALDVLESLYIHVLSPPLNGRNHDGSRSAPVPLMKLMRSAKR
jgi:hypothetical protein